MFSLSRRVPDACNHQGADKEDKIVVDAFQELGEHCCNTSLCLKKVVDKGSSFFESD